MGQLDEQSGRPDATGHRVGSCGMAFINDTLHLSHLSNEHCQLCMSRESILNQIVSCNTTYQTVSKHHLYITAHKSVTGRSITTLSPVSLSQQHTSQSITTLSPVSFITTNQQSMKISARDNDMQNLSQTYVCSVQQHKQVVLWTDEGET